MTELYSNLSPVSLDLQLSATPWVAGGGCGRMRDASLSADVPTERAYDGMRVFQERDGNHTPTVSYTRGTDLSGSLEGADGIGGLLARSHGYSSGNWSTHNFFHADGGGNVAYLVNSSQGLAASYKYDPYGRVTSQSGALSSANLYRFSSKEVNLDYPYAGGLYYYGYRWYAPSLQRWLNRDPAGTPADRPGFRPVRKDDYDTVVVQSILALDDLHESLTIQTVLLRKPCAVEIQARE